MTYNQEDALYDFLDGAKNAFSLDDLSSCIYLADPKPSYRLNAELEAFLNSRHLAFRAEDGRWVSRRCCFESALFVINPSRLELLNGILIPGHRCIPFANPDLLPQEYVFLWKNKEIPFTDTQGEPEEFYPYYSIYGEEYAPQYVARDNPENEQAFSNDLYEDPPEVSVQTLDMRNIYRETSFVPGDRFIAGTIDWNKGIFSLQRVGKDEWEEKDLAEWFTAAEAGFEASFRNLGPLASTEEQIAFAYWLGGPRMRNVPAYSLEEFLYEKTDRIERVNYGIESRYWFAGKDIPDSKGLSGIAMPPDHTPIEEILLKANVPISEYVILSYVRDAMFRNETDIDKIPDRIVPPSIHLEEAAWNMLADYISETMDELGKHYTFFLDQGMGPIRQRAGELHTAVVELAARLLQKGGLDSSWLPRHTFIMLSQIQGHAASLLEDLNSDDPPPESELDAMDNSLDSMVETFGDIKEMIDDAMNNYRRNNLQIIRFSKESDSRERWQSVQISAGGTDVWRRAVIPSDRTLGDLHKVIQVSMGWKDSYQHRFYTESPRGKKILEDKIKIEEAGEQGINELQYEYGTKWNVKAIFLSPHRPGKGETIRLVAGEGAAPPELIGGPLRFRKMLGALEGGSDMEKQAALHELGSDFVPRLFDMDKCNRNLDSVFLAEK